MLCHITFSLYLIIYTNHFLQGLAEDVESMELNVAKGRGTASWVQKTLGRSKLGWTSIWKAPTVGRTRPGWVAGPGM